MDDIAILALIIAENRIPVWVLPEHTKISQKCVLTTLIVNMISVK